MSTETPTTGRAPETRALDETVLGDGRLLAREREVIQEILPVLAGYAPDAISTTITLGAENMHVIRAVPTEAGCCPFSLYLNHGPWVDAGAGTIGLSAGEEAHINIPEDVEPYPAPVEQTSKIVGAAVEAILQGALTEDIYETARGVYRSVFDLPTRLCTLGVDRSKSLPRICAVFRKTRTRHVTYMPMQTGE